MKRFCKLQSIAAFLAMQLSLSAMAEDWAWAPHLPEGANLPNFSVLDTSGKPVTLEQLAGEKGTLLLFSRSAVW